MADLQLRIKADFEEASRQFKALAEAGDLAALRLRNFGKEFAAEQVDRFIDKQHLAGAAITATRGTLAAAEAQKAAYGREIERLIKSGLDPECDAIKKLRTEHESLAAKIKETTDAQKAHEQAVQVAQNALMGVTAAAAALGAAVGAMTQKTAEAGDQYAKTARVVGLTAESFQELEYAAKQSGLSGDVLKGSLMKLNKSMGDIKSGSGTLNTYLEKNNKALLEEVKSAGSSEKAFSLLMDAIKKAPNEFEKTALAQAAFGRSGTALINFAENGAEGIAALREEAKKYGIISNEQAEASERYIDAQTRFKAALDGVRNTIGAELIPTFTDVMNKAAEFIAGIDNWKGILRTAAIGIGAVTAALTTFVAVSKGHAIITAMSVAIRALMAAITGPAGIAALAVGALATGIGVLISKHKDAKRAADEYAETIKKGTYEQQQYRREITATAEALRDTVSATARAISQMDAEGDSVTANLLYGYYENASSRSSALLRGATDDARRYEAEMERLLEQINTRLAESGRQFRGEAGREAITDIVSTKVELQKILSAQKLTHEQNLGEMTNAVKSFLSQRADLEGKSGAARIQAFRDESEKLLELQTLDADQRLAIQKAADEAIDEYRNKWEEETEKKRKKAMDDRIRDIHKEAEELKSAVSVALSMIPETEEQIQNAMRDQFSKFIQDRLAAEDAYREASIGMEKLAGEARLEFMQQQSALILAQFETDSEKYLAAQKALNAAIAAEDRNLANTRAEIKAQELAFAISIMGSMESLTNKYNEENRAAVAFSKLMGLAQVAINTSIGISNAIAQFGPPPSPLGIAGIAAAIATGATATTGIIATSIPSPTSAETGGRFIVPDVSPRIDGVGLKVNPGERIDVTPRGMVGNEQQAVIINLLWDRRVLASAINQLARDGELHCLRLAGNL